MELPRTRQDFWRRVQSRPRPLQPYAKNTGATVHAMTLITTKTVRMMMVTVVNVSVEIYHATPTSRRSLRKMFTPYDCDNIPGGVKICARENETNDRTQKLF